MSEARRRAAVVHLEAALERIAWAAEELRDDAALAAVLKLSRLREDLAGQCEELQRPCLSVVGE